MVAIPVSHSSPCAFRPWLGVASAMALAVRWAAVFYCNDTTVSRISQYAHLPLPIRGGPFPVFANHWHHCSHGGGCGYAFKPFARVAADSWLYALFLAA